MWDIPLYTPLGIGQPRERSLRGSQSKVTLKVDPTGVGALFVISEISHAFLHVLDHFAQGHLGTFCVFGVSFAIKGFHQGVGEEAVLLVTALVGVLPRSRLLASPFGLCQAKAIPLFPQLGVRRSQSRNGHVGFCAILSGTGLSPHSYETTLYIHAI